MKAAPSTAPPPPPPPGPFVAPLQVAAGGGAKTSSRIRAPVVTSPTEPPSVPPGLNPKPRKNQEYRRRARDRVINPRCVPKFGLSLPKFG